MVGGERVEPAGWGEAADNAIDGDVSTIWHTQYGSVEPSCPHEIVVDMGLCYVVDEFIYVSRKDGSNGRIKEFELYLSNNPGAWGAPVACGAFSNTSEEQSVKLPENVSGRYFKLVALSEVNNKAWASAAELSIKASAIVDSPDLVEVEPIESGAVYRLRETGSKRCLKEYSGSTEGTYVLGEVEEGGKYSLFTLTRLDGFTSLYNIAGQSGFMNKGEGGWRVVYGRETEAPDGVVRIEDIGANRHRLSAMWNSSRYFNFDSFSEGAFVYADKAAGAVFELEIVDEASMDLPAVSSVMVYPVVTPGDVNLLVPEPSMVSVVDVSGKTLDCFYAEGEMTCNLDFPCGLYILSVKPSAGGIPSTHRIIIRK